MSYGADIILALFLSVAFVFYLFFCCMLYKPKPSTVVPLEDDTNIENGFYSI